MGVDLALSALVASADTLNVSLAYLDAKFTSTATISYNPIDSCAAFNNNPGANPNQQVTVGSYVLDGAPQPRSPKLSGTVSWEHRFRLPGDMSLAGRPVVHYQDSSYVHPVEYNVSYQPAFTTYELSMTLSCPKATDGVWLCGVVT